MYHICIHMHLIQHKDQCVFTKFQYFHIANVLINLYTNWKLSLTKLNTDV